MGGSTEVERRRIGVGLARRPGPAPVSSYGDSVRTPRKTLWEEGKHPGQLVRAVAVAVLVATAFLDVLVFDRLSLLFEVVFVALCVGIALLVRPRDFFVIGVLPPLMMLGAVSLLALFRRDAVAERGDGLVQAAVSGLAHHAGALVTGYVLTLAILALRQRAYRNSGVLLSGVLRSPSTSERSASGHTA